MTDYAEERRAARGGSVAPHGHGHGPRRGLPIGPIFVVSVLATYAALGTAVYLAVEALFM